LKYKIFGSAQSNNIKLIRKLLLPTCVNLAGKVERWKSAGKGHAEFGISTDNDTLYLIGCETCMQH
jgi:hypothetical protein